jgi:hypothetical protein
MKSRTIVAFWLALIIFCLSNTNASATDYPTLTAPSGTISTLNTSYADYMTDVWTIAVPNVLDKIVISYTCDLEPNDYLIFYSVDDAGNLSSGTTFSQGSGTFTTWIANGKAKVKLVTNNSISNSAGYKGFSLQYVLYNSSSQAQVLNYQGNTILSGNVGIGTLSPKTKLDIAGTVRGNGISGSLNILTDNGTLEMGPQDGTYTRFVTNKSYYLFDKTMFSLTGKYGALDQDLCFYTTWNRRMVINNSTGNVGIGVPIGTNPSQALTLKGGMSISPSAVTPIETCLGSLMITKPATAAQFINLSRVGNTPWSIGTVYGTNDFGIGQGTTSDAGFNNPYFRITSTGTVGIKTLNPNSAYALDVNGIICANEVKVTLDHFADFVFDSKYNLPKLNDVHRYIKANGHLPEIPSADEVKKNGMNVADMQVMLLKKIEELTLYAIEQQKRIEALEKTLKEK